MKRTAVFLLALLLAAVCVACKADKTSTDYVTQIDIAAANSTAQEVYAALTSGNYYAMSRLYYLSELTQEDVPLISIGGREKCAVIKEKSDTKYLYLCLESYTDTDAASQEWVIGDVRYMEKLYPAEKLDEIWDLTEGMPLPSLTIQEEN